MENLQNYLDSIRRDFADKPLSKSILDKNPFQQFEIWMREAIDSKILDPHAMSLSTVDSSGQPSTRIVYLRDLSDEGFTFYTNYKSQKGKDMENNNKVGLNFFWREIDRQIRIEGEVEKVTPQQSDNYYEKRPRESQIGAWASDQSEDLSNRTELEEKIIFYTEKFHGKAVPRPKNWGGYIVKPIRIEFWQGRPNRLHDRLVYLKTKENWDIRRVSP